MVAISSFGCLYEQTWPFMHVVFKRLRIFWGMVSGLCEGLFARTSIRIRNVGICLVVIARANLSDSILKVF